MKYLLRKCDRRILLLILSLDKIFHNRQIISCCVAIFHCIAIFYLAVMIWVRKGVEVSKEKDHSQSGLFLLLF